MKGIIHTILLTFLCQLAWGQQVMVKGKVFDQDTKEPLPFCNVYIKGTTRGVSTDLEGNYTIDFGKAGDTLVVSAVGYTDGEHELVADSLQLFNFYLAAAALGLDEVVIVAGENPANRIVREIIAHKDQNRVENIESYQCEQYAKLEFDMDDIPENLQDNKLLKPFAFIFENIDSTSDEKPFLPIYLNESLYDLYHAKAAGKPKRIIKAQKVSLNQTNQSFTEFIKLVDEDISIYDNWLYILEKSFVSPFANSGLFYYDYYIIDSTYLNGHWSYQLKFKPKRKQETTFYGDFWVADTSFAVQRVNMRMSPDININFINRIIIYQEFMPQESHWLPTKTKLVLDIKPTKKTTGLIARSTNTFTDYTLNTPQIVEVYKNAKTTYDFDAIKVEDSEFWNEKRHEPLTQTESNIYGMIDSIANVPIYKTYIDVLYFLYNGFIDLGKIEIGSFSNLYGVNAVEGNRFRFGANTTANFSKKYFASAYLAYGTNDQQFKYGAELKWAIRKNPRTQLGIRYINDISLNSENSESFRESDLFTGVLRRDILQKLIKVEETKIYLERFWSNDFSNKVVLLRRTMDPYGQILDNQRGFNYAYLPDPENPTKIDTTISTSELILKARYAPGERFLDGNFNRVSMGSRNPIVEFQYALGLRALEGNFNYHKFALSYRHYFYINPVGWLSYRASIGKTFGTLPYLLLEVHPGNEGFFFTNTAFNTMNSYEFASDTYASLFLEHHFDGFFLNKIPLIRKLNWREVVSLKAIIGTLSNENRAVNQLNLFDPSISENTYNGFRVPSSQPFLEASVGIENILKIFSVHTLWRLNYLDNPQASRFNLRVGVNFYL